MTLTILVLGMNHVLAEKIRVGRDYQAVVPEFIPLGGKNIVFNFFTYGCNISLCYIKYKFSFFVVIFII